MTKLHYFNLRKLMKLFITSILLLFNPFDVWIFPLQLTECKYQCKGSPNSTVASVFKTMVVIIQKNTVRALKLINNIASSNEILRHQIDCCSISYEYWESYVFRNRANYYMSSHILYSITWLFDSLATYKLLIVNL